MGMLPYLCNKHFVPTNSESHQILSNVKKPNTPTFVSIALSTADFSRHTHSINSSISLSLRRKPTKKDTTMAMATQAGATKLTKNPFFTKKQQSFTCPHRQKPRTLVARSAVAAAAAKIGKDCMVKSVKAKQMIDSRGNLTVEVDLITGDDLYRSAVPSGASTGIYEALELRDGDKSVYGGKGVLSAVENSNQVWSPKLVGVDVR